jgi:hypothetical protein
MANNTTGFYDGNSEMVLRIIRLSLKQQYFPENQERERGDGRFLEGEAT